MVESKNFIVISDFSSPHSPHLIPILLILLLRQNQTPATSPHLHGFYGPSHHPLSPGLLKSLQIGHSASTPALHTHTPCSTQHREIPVNGKSHHVIPPESTSVKPHAHHEAVSGPAAASAFLATLAALWVPHARALSSTVRCTCPPQGVRPASTCRVLPLRHYSCDSSGSLYQCYLSSELFPYRSIFKKNPKTHQSPPLPSPRLAVFSP